VEGTFAVLNVRLDPNGKAAVALHSPASSIVQPVTSNAFVAPPAVTTLAVTKLDSSSKPALVR